MSTLRLLAALIAVCCTTTARADDLTSYAWSEPGMQWNVGVSLTMGLGTGAFRDGSTDAMAGKAVVWSSRALFGSHIPLGLEAAFAASTYAFNTTEGMRGSVDGQVTDLCAHWTVLPHSPLTPYAFLAIGWSRYKASEAVGVLGLSCSTEVPSLPYGGGLTYRTARGFVVDARATYRSISTSDSLERAGVALSSWEATASFGIEI